MDSFVDRLQRFSFHPPCYPSYEAFDFYLGGTSYYPPLNTPAFTGRTTQRADFPHWAFLFASRQSLCDLSCWSDFRKRMPIPTAAEQPQGFVQPLPTPPPPAEALKSPGWKPQNVSGFALMYILLRRSCKLTGAFIIHPCPPWVSENCTSAGPLRSTDITPLPRYYWPLRHPLVFHRFPGFTSYTVCCSADFSAGRGGLLQLLSASLSSCCR